MGITATSVKRKIDREITTKWSWSTRLALYSYNLNNAQINNKENDQQDSNG